ncbi:hypothetical protein Pmani_008975 [Petrolisthes manimaculis]|uniref:Gag-like protein n=1 Tax=Petrolisthes manimaculis TaxID=1843537 RepID=A0AAE1Q4F7_9EUCA|nr:hypothetical protein Pmani_008975 [Petrolisthes manimaculis]
MRTRNRPGSEDEDPGLHTFTLHQSDSGKSSPAKPTETHQNDSYIPLIKNSETTCANNSETEATAATLSPDDSFTANTITSDNQMNGWTEVKSQNLKRKEQQAKNSHEKDYSVTKKNEQQAKNFHDQENSASTYLSNKLLITLTQHFPTAYDVVEALETEHPTLIFHIKMISFGNILLTPPDTDTLHLLKNITELRGKPISITAPKPPLTQAILLRYPIMMPLQPILKHPMVSEAKRCTMPTSGNQTRQVQITIRGPLPPYLKLGNILHPSIHKITTQMLQMPALWASQNKCQQQERCAICSSSHATEVCLTKLKQQKNLTTQCPNCNMNQHAWNRSCPTRQALIQARKEKQDAWITTYKPTPARPTLFANLQQQQQIQQSLIPTAADFPTLQEATKPGAKMTYSQAVAYPPLLNTAQPTPEPTPVPPRPTQIPASSQTNTILSLPQPIPVDHTPKTQTSHSTQPTQPSNNTQEENALVKVPMKIPPPTQNQSDNIQEEDTPVKVPIPPQNPLQESEVLVLHERASGSSSGTSVVSGANCTC